MGCFFPFDSHPMVYFIKSKIHGFPHQFPITWQNAVKSIGRAWEIATHFFSLMYGYFSSIRYPSYRILYHMGNAWLFPSITNSTGKYRKTHPVGSQVVFGQY